MRLFLGIVLISCVYGCQFNSSVDSGNRLTGETQKKIFIPPGYRANQPSSLKKFNEEEVDFRFECNLVAYGRFVFFEYAEVSKSQKRRFRNCTSLYDLPSSQIRVYDIGNHPAKVRYNKVIGRTMTINLRDHTRYPAKIKSLVLVEDKVTGKSYFAGVVDLPDNASKGWEWANTSTRINPFPFVETPDETTADMAMAHFDSLAEFHIYKEKVAKKILNVMQYEETSVRGFDAREGEKYVLVQHNWYDAARKPICNYSAFYHVTGSGWMLETEGKLDLPFLDLVDTDGDFYPELLTGSDVETAIYEINYKGFSKKFSLVFEQMAGG